MNEKILYYYQQELAFIRNLGDQFADAHPKIAKHLHTQENKIEDPHVTRMIEAFALANARTRYKLDTDLPEITDTLLNVLYPDYLSPIPSMSIFQFQPVSGANKKFIPANTLINSDPSHGEICYFTTRYPVEITSASVEHATLTTKAPYVLHLTLKTNQINFNNLRFFINAQTTYAAALYELLFKHTTAIGFSTSTTDQNPLILNKKHLQPVGFAEHENMLPYSKRTFMGHRLLTEFFAFPEKFLFFDLVQLKEVIQKKFNSDSKTIEIYFYLNQTHALLEKNLNAKFFALNCTPIVNLYQKQAEPFELTHTKTEYPLIADSQRSPQATEIYAVKRVIASIDNGKQMEYKPFYGSKRHPISAYYHLNRIAGTNISLSFINPEFTPPSNEKWIISADIYCTNRDLPRQLPFGADLPQLSLSHQKTDDVAKIKCLTPFTPTRHPSLRQDAQWRYITHLALNHTSLIDHPEGVEILRSILKLYDFDNTGEHQNIFKGILNLKTNAITVRNPKTPYGNVFRQGTQITLQVDESKFSSTHLYLFGCILERFFMLYTTINSFIQLTLSSKHGNAIHQWEPRIELKKFYPN